MSKAPWPRLFEQLTGERRPDRCQSCSAQWVELTRWQEHDENDKPEPIVVVLCLDCSERLVGKHARLYRELGRNEPFPGAMQLCVNCKRRDGVRCAHPDLKANGGAGLKITGPVAQTMHLDYSTGRGRRGTTIRSWPSEPDECAGREAAGVLVNLNQGESST